METKKQAYVLIQDVLTIHTKRLKTSFTTQSTLEYKNGNVYLITEYIEKSKKTKKAFLFNSKEYNYKILRQLTNIIIQPSGNCQNDLMYFIDFMQVDKNDFSNFIANLKYKQGYFIKE